MWSGRGDPAPDIGLRSGSGGEIRIALPSGVLVGTVDSARAASTVHPGAIYLHQGQAYRVQVLDYDDRAAIVEPDDGATTTRPRSSSDLDLLGTDRTREVGALTLSLGPVAVRSQVVGYQRTDSFTGEVIENVDLELPPSTLVTRSFWYTFDAGVVAASGVSPEQLARCPARPRARRHRVAPALHHLRPLGRGRHLHRVARRHRRAHGRHLRRLPGRRGRCGAGVRRRRSPPRRHAGRDRGVRLPRGVPVVRAVAEVRQRQRAARQGRGRGVCCGHRWLPLDRHGRRRAAR